MKPTVLVVFLLLAAGSAAAQSGPDPAYDSAVEYAAAYAQERAGNASADPVGTVAEAATPEAAQAEVAHTAFVACWALDDAGLEPEACADYYTPRGAAPPEQPEAEPVETEAADAFVNETAANTDALAGNATTFLNATLADPANATDHAQEFLDAVVGFVEDLLDGVATLVDALAGGLLDCVGLVGDGIGLGVQGVGDGAGFLVTALGDGLGLGLDGIEMAAQGTAHGATSGFAALGDGVLTIAHGARDAAHFVTDGAAATAGALGSGIQDAGSGAAHAVQDAAEATGDAVADAARAVGDAIGRMLGQDPAPKAGGAAPDLDLDTPVDTDGLLDDVTGLLE